MVFVLYVAPADMASGPVVTVKPSASPSSYHLDAPAAVAYTDTTYRINWAGPACDRIALYYVINGKDYFIINVVGTGTYTYWRPPERPDPANLRDSVFHNVKLKAVWQTRLSGGGYKNASTQTSDYFTIARPGSFVIVEQSLPSAYSGQPYGFDLHADNGVPPYRWSLASGTLPPGMTLNANGRILGTPMAAGSRTVKVHASDAGVDVATDDMIYTITVLEREGDPTPAPEAFDFEMDWITDKTLNRPAEGYNTVSSSFNVRTMSGSPEMITLELTGCPSHGVDYAFTPRTALPGNSFHCYLNVTASNDAPTGVYDLVVHARSTSGVEHTQAFRLNITDAGTRGDISLKQAYWLGNVREAAYVMPVQVLDDMQWIVKGKNTIFHATIASTFSEDKDVYVELWLPIDDWVWAGQETGISRNLLTSSGTYNFPEHFVYGTTVTVPANGEVELILPDPAGLVNDTVHSSPYRVFDEYDIVMNAPRPSRASHGDVLDEPVYSVVIDPLDRIREDDERNNYPPSGYQRIVTVDSARLNVLFTPFLSDNYDTDDFWPGGVEGLAYVNDWVYNMSPQAKRSMEFMIGVYPVADQGKLSYYLNPSLVIASPWGANSEREQVHLQEDLADMAAENGYDRIVALVPDGWYPYDPEWGGVVWNRNPRACFVRIGQRSSVVTHENYHNLNHGDIDSTTNNRDFPADDGYWVNKLQVKDVAADDIRDYMDYTNMSHWTTKARYTTVKDELPRSEDPPVLLFRCLLDKNGGITVKPFMIFDGWPDVAPSEWTHKIVLKDSGGSVVREQMVNVIFSADIYPGEGASGEPPTADEAFISATVPWSDDVATIELRDSAGVLLAERTVSQHAPTVDITEPVPGTGWNYGETYKVKWAGSDPDGDALNYSLSISTDKTNWLPVALDVAAGEYLFDTATVRAGNYYFRVRATDGVLSASDVMDQSIEVRITGPVSTAMPSPPATAHTATQGATQGPGSAGQSPISGIGLPVMLLAGGLIAVVAVGLVLMGLLRKK